MLSYAIDADASAGGLVGGVCWAQWVPSKTQVSSSIWLPDWPPNSTVELVAASKAKAALTRAGGDGVGANLVQVSRALELGAPIAGVPSASRPATATSGATATSRRRHLVERIRTGLSPPPSCRVGNRCRGEHQSYPMTPRSAGLGPSRPP